MQNSNRDNFSLASIWRAVFRRPLPLEAETTLFLLMSAGDVFMTYLVLRTGQFVESNPVAAFFFYGWGMRGMVYFKFGMTAFVCAIAQIIAARRVETARKLLQFASVIVGAVVAYTAVMLFRTGAFRSLL